jgi:hypothetical protein
MTELILVAVLASPWIVVGAVAAVELVKALADLWRSR